jgi:hypothetical protein
VLGVWVSGVLRCILKHSGQCLYSVPTGAKSDLRLTFRNFNYWRKSERVSTVLGGTSVRRLSRELSEGGAISGVDTRIYICIYVQSTLTARRQVERRMTKLLCYETRRMLTPIRTTSVIACTGRSHVLHCSTTSLSKSPIAVEAFQVCYFPCTENGGHWPASKPDHL